ncbi:MAG: DUF4450 domain-containing protein [Prolixibacteraceae bacterium]
MNNPNNSIRAHCAKTSLGNFQDTQSLAVKTTFSHFYFFCAKAMALIILVLFFACTQAPKSTESAQLWHNQTRELRYTADGNDFVIKNGEKRFNRALYGTNTGFRVEAGDLPEFGLYMTRLGGTLRLGLMNADTSIWLIDAAKIEMRYNAGSIRYSIKDPILKKGTLQLEVLALQRADGMIMKLSAANIPLDVQLVWAFGGATGKRFSRDGDLGADPESNFYLKAENCVNNDIFLKDAGFQLYYGSGRALSDNEIYENNYQPSPEELAQTELQSKKRIAGFVPSGSTLKIGDAARQKSPSQLSQSEVAKAPVVVGTKSLVSDKQEYFMLYNPDTGLPPNQETLPVLFAETDSIRRSIADRFWMHTPDPYLNAAGAQLATAADAIWDGTSYMHGAIAWRMPLPGWRGAYAADWLGTHDRAKSHFKGYFAAQYTEPESGPVEPDPKTHLARHKEEKGTSIFTSGYISRNPNKQNKPHHYDMNLVFIDQLLWHFKWTGDTLFLKESWPYIERHMAWEKRNFDPDDDGLYNAYAAIWASDALQYSGGAVTHASAYNFSANKQVAELARLIGVDPKPYEKEAEKIIDAVNQRLWMPDKGWYAEYQDLLGKKLVHPSAGVWTIYHAIDEGLSDPFQAYQSTKYVDNYIPHIPVRTGKSDHGENYTLSTTNWMPYTWSINNVAMAEVLHTALAYWQAGRSEEACRLMKGTVYDFMYLGSSPGNFGQLSFYDAFRGELYRDFADPVGVASRAFVEGLFGVQPDLLRHKIKIQPGWPEEWPYAQMKTSDISIDFSRSGKNDKYGIETGFHEMVELELVIQAKNEVIEAIRVNGQNVLWKNNTDAVGKPQIIIQTDLGKKFNVEIEWGDEALKLPENTYTATSVETLKFIFGSATLNEVYDPQKVFSVFETGTNSLSAQLNATRGMKTFFVQVKQGDYQWWHPIEVCIQPSIELVVKDNAPENRIQLALKNNTKQRLEGVVHVNGFRQSISIASKALSPNLSIPVELMLPGTNVLELNTGEQIFQESLMAWELHADPTTKFETIGLATYFNDRVVNIFKEQYYEPRSPYPTLSIPVQGIGDWCSYAENEEINDEGLRAKAGDDHRIVSPQGIPFDISSKSENNIVFSSQWNNYPNSVSIELDGVARHLYLLMAGSVHHMQSRTINGIIKVYYTDGSADSLQLISPENWWPIEQDYYQDGFAFNAGQPQPPRLYLKTGQWHMDTYTVLGKNGTNKIEGGAAQLLDLPLNLSKELKALSIETCTNDIVMGIMGITLVRTSE